MRREEAAIQRAVMQHWRLRGNGLLFAVPNGGARNIITAKNLKLEGVMPGVADLIGARDGKFYALEIKTSTGRMSDEQEAFRGRWMNEGGWFECARGLDWALNTLKYWGFL